MKAQLIGAAAFGLANIALAQPHQGHMHLHKRVENTQTVTDYVTVEREEIVVYLDEDGKPVATSTFYTGLVPTPTPTPSSTPAPAPAPSSTESPAAVFHQVETSSSAAPAPPPAPKSSTPAPAPSSHSSSSGSDSGSNSGSASGTSAGQGFGSGIAYSPYQPNGNCKSTSEVKSDVAGIGPVDLIRLYGTDCDQVANTLAAVQGSSTKLMAGVFDLGSWKSEVDTIVSAVKGDWSHIHTVNIGNELVNGGKASASSVASAVAAAKTYLRSKGFQGNVVTVDTMVAHKNNPELSSTSDFLAMNCHPFFDGHTEPSASGTFIQGWMKQLSGIAGGKPIITTETGFPWKGDTNGVATPSPQNQQTALSAIKSALSSNVIILSSYDDMWKKNAPGTFNAEQYWGTKNHDT